MMQRLEATRVVAELAGESPIVGGVGNSTFDLIPFDRPAYFLMWNSMGIHDANAVLASQADAPLCYWIWHPAKAGSGGRWQVQW
jgi:hypothetical protein